jgi:hypothetical protein
MQLWLLELWDATWRKHFKKGFQSTCAQETPT